MKLGELIDIVTVSGNVFRKKHFWRIVSQNQAFSNLITYAINKKVIMMSFMFFSPILKVCTETIKNSKVPGTNFQLVPNPEYIWGYRLLVLL